MKRPFLIVALLSLILSFIALYVGLIGVIIYSFIAVVLLLAIFILNKTAFVKMIVPIIFLAVAFLNSFMVMGNLQEAKSISDKEITIKGIVTENPISYDNGQSFIIKTKNPKTKVFVFSSTEYDIKAGDRITALLEVSKENKDYKFSNYSSGIYISSFLREISAIKRPEFSIYKVVADYRSYIENTIFKNVSDKNAPILIALTTGNKNYIDILSQKYINNCGVSHIMAVSGLHFGIISFNIVKFLRRLKLKETLVSAVGIISVLFIILACGFQISAVRAAVVYLILYLGNIINRKGEGLNSLSVAITLLVLANPFVIGSVSFLLSVSATFGILILYPMLTKLLGKIKVSGKIGKYLNYALDIALISFAAIICSMPIIVYYFGAISIAAILVNVLILFAVNAALVLTVIGLIVSVIPLIKTLSLVPFFLSEIFTEYFMAVVRFFGNFKSSVIYVGKEMSIFWLIFAVLIIVFSYLGCKNIKKEG